MKMTVADGVSENFALRHKNGTSSQNMLQVLTRRNQPVGLARELAFGTDEKWQLLKLA